jgi:KDO2-lipid IV(A) lauroyltransferase
VPFFGRQAFTPIGAATLALRSGSPVVVGSIRRAAGDRHVVQIDPCALPDDVTEATALLTARLEARIRRHPTQWVWFHRRWRTRPADREAA